MQKLPTNFYVTIRFQVSMAENDEDEERHGQMEFVYREPLIALQQMLIAAPYDVHQDLLWQPSLCKLGEQHEFSDFFDGLAARHVCTQMQVHCLYETLLDLCKIARCTQVCTIYARLHDLCNLATAEASSRLELQL